MLSEELEQKFHSQHSKDTQTTSPSGDAALLGSLTL